MGGSADRSIGIATMMSDGAIVLDLRANEGGRHAATRVTYTREHPSYAEVLKHLGDMKPGDTRPVPPWE